MFNSSLIRGILLLFVMLMELTGSVNASEKPPLDVSHKRKVLIVMTNHADYPSRNEKTGLWLTELTDFYDVIMRAGYEIDLASSLGGKVPLDERSLGFLHIDSAAKAYLSEPIFKEHLEMTKSLASLNPREYVAIYLAGGHGAMWDFRENTELKYLAEAIYQQGGFVSSVCHGAAGLLDLQNEQGRPLIEGRHLTGFSNIEENLSGVKDQVPFSLQDELVARGANYSKAIFPFLSYAVTDGRLITGQNPSSGGTVARALLQAMQTDHSE